MTDEAFTWDQEQWGRVRQAIHDQAMRARVAASFLPLYGPLSSSAQTVPENRLADHRVGFKSNNLDAVMNGDLDPVIGACIEADTKERLATFGD